MILQLAYCCLRKHVINQRDPILAPGDIQKHDGNFRSKIDHQSRGSTEFHDEAHSSP